MSHYFTREEAEALLPAISVVLRSIQETRVSIRAVEDELEAARMGSMSNGHHLHEGALKLQQELATLLRALRTQLSKLQEFGCELKDADTGLIDFLSLRDGQEVYLCWRLGEDRIRFWHYLDTGFAGRQPL
ncbi:MAG: DUF2203 domain-containing protein [Chloroflexi bacterium]|nr:DUF2203 domain-containing protein [Ktedonobacteraceae bacterium]MBV8822567.1 DUF2203 domain-containing protein [Ktedonobacteraceae bacterium]MBV9022047.1 DUF2203 domain-containing protein [Ktedonobacteraceae bacterium]MBV9707385.1 DUF2203 domain-containing protein [Chloroflexota bacterium]